LIKKIKEKITNRKLFFTIDQEMGNVNRIGKELKNLPGGRKFGEIKDRKLRKKIAKKLAQALEYAGINVNFAPVADICKDKTDFMYKRSFGSTVSEVSEAIEDWLLGFKTTKIISVIKHFPGHGRTKVDSHKQLPIRDIKLKTWEKNDLLPFVAGINLGVKGIMLGHLYYPQIDSNPTPVSNFFINYLRNNLNYTGFIFTDDIEMEGFLKTKDKLVSKLEFLAKSNINYIVLGKNLNQKNIFDVEDYINKNIF